MRTRAIARRILAQIRHDKRTMALILIAPLLVLTLVYFILDAGSDSYSVAVINAPSKMIDQMKDSSDADFTVHENYTKEEALSAIKDEKVTAAIDASSDCSRIKIYVDGTNASDAQKIKAAVTKCAAAVVRADMKSRISSAEKLLSSMPAASSAKITYVEPKINTDYVYGSADGSLFDQYGSPLIGIIIFFFVFLIAGINFLNERTSGTLEKLMTTPVRGSEITGGYILGFGLLAIAQTIIISLYTVYVLGMTIEGSIWYMLLVNLLTSVCALALGMLLSTLASSEFQMIQFIPIAILPQVFLCGLFRLEGGWDIAGHFIPLYYTTDALTNVMIRGRGFSSIATDCAVIIGFTLALLLLNTRFLRRCRN